MTPISPSAAPIRLAWLALLATALVTGSFLSQAWCGLNLWDESYLWYGSQRVLQGEVPLRDFGAYDPGRYYWVAGIMAVWGSHGIVAQRAAEAAAQALGLVAACWLLVRTCPMISRSPTWLLCCALTVLGWMTPGFKSLDFAVSIGLVAALIYLAERPDRRRLFIWGVAVGAAAVIGRNHGVYGLIASLIAFPVLLRSPDPGHRALPLLATWAGGVVVGYLPILTMLVACPGFARPFWESVWYLIETQTFNYPLPIRWPWIVRVGSLGWGIFIQDFLAGLVYVGLVVFAAGGLLWVVWRAVRRPPVAPGLLACIALGVPYAHYAFARADAEHMALGIFPPLLGCLIWLSAQRPVARWGGGLMILATTLAITVPTRHLWRSWRFNWTDHITVCGDTLLCSAPLAREIAFLKELKARYVPPGGTFLATPFWPGAYAAMEVRSPVWDIYAMVPSSEEFQTAEIQRLRATPPAFVVLQDMAFDDREDLRFRNMHPLLERYLRDHFAPVQGIDVPQPVSDLKGFTRLEALTPRPAPTANAAP